MKLVVLRYSQLTVNDRSADKRSGTVVSRQPPPLPHTSGKRERSAAAADASDLVGISVCVTNASGHKQLVIATGFITFIHCTVL